MTTGDWQLPELLETLDSGNFDERVRAIELLGELGDDQALKAIRARLQLANRELSVLIAAVGKLKIRLGVK